MLATLSSEQDGSCWWPCPVKKAFHCLFPARLILLRILQELALRWPLPCSASPNHAPCAASTAVASCPPALWPHLPQRPAQAPALTSPPVLPAPARLPPLTPPWDLPAAQREAGCTICPEALLVCQSTWQGQRPQPPPPHPQTLCAGWRVARPAGAATAACAPLSAEGWASRGGERRLLPLKWGREVHTVARECRLRVAVVGSTPG